MKWSYRLGTFFGIGVDVHVTFLLLLAYVAWSSYSASSSWLVASVGVLFVLALFLFVVMHEYGHALTARHFGIRTRRITLYPIGGMAMLEGMPRSPRQQLLVALAGPAVNFVLAALIGALMLAIGADVSMGAIFGERSSGLLSSLLYVNLLLGAFNLIPALPMDGGRVLRAFLEMRMGPVRATDIAARVARVLAFGMGIFALMDPQQPILFAIALMVWFMAGVERFQTRQLEAMRARGQIDPYGLTGSSPTGQVPRARPPSAYGGRHEVVEVVDGPNGPTVRIIRS